MGGGGVDQGSNEMFLKSKQKYIFAFKIYLFWAKAKSCSNKNLANT